MQLLPFPSSTVSKLPSRCPGSKSRSIKHPQGFPQVPLKYLAQRPPTVSSCRASALGGLPNLGCWDGGIGVRVRSLETRTFKLASKARGTFWLPLPFFLKRDSAACHGMQRLWGWEETGPKIVSSQERQRIQCLSIHP